MPDTPKAADPNLNEVSKRGFPKEVIAESSGLKVTLIKAIQGKDMSQAARMLGRHHRDTPDNVLVQAAVLAIVCRFGCAQESWGPDRVLELPAEDLVQLAQEAKADPLSASTE